MSRMIFKMCGADVSAWSPPAFSTQAPTPTRGLVSRTTRITQPRRPLLHPVKLYGREPFNEPTERCNILKKSVFYHETHPQRDLPGMGV